jgi:hypothetical protein
MTGAKRADAAVSAAARRMCRRQVKSCEPVSQCRRATALTVVPLL